METYQTTIQAASRWNVTRQLVVRWIAADLIPGCTRFGRDWLIPVDAARPVPTRDQYDSQRATAKAKRLKSQPKKRPVGRPKKTSE